MQLAGAGERGAVAADTGLHHAVELVDAEADRLDQAGRALLNYFNVIRTDNINEFLTEIEFLDDEYKEQEKNIKNAKRNI